MVNYNCDDNIYNTTISNKSIKEINTVDIILILIHSFIFVIGFIGNCSVIYYFGCKSKRKRDYDYQIISLSTADLLASLIAPVTYIFPFLCRNPVLDYMSCKLVGPLFNFTLLVSALTLMLISFARYGAISSSTRKQTQRTTSFCQIFVVWLLSGLFMVPYIVELEAKNGHCRFKSWTTADFFLYSTVYYGFSCLLPMAFMVGLYSIASFKLKNRKIPGQYNYTYTHRERHSEKITSMFKTIVVIFFVLTTPDMLRHFIVQYLLLHVLKVRYSPYFHYLSVVTFGLVLLNSCINPFIYAKMHRKMKSSIFSGSLVCRQPEKTNEETLIADMATDV